MGTEKKTALITGATGQVAAYLARLLLLKGYKVYMTDRFVNTSQPGTRHWRLDELCILNRINIVSANLSNYDSMYNAVSQIKPDEIYHLAANSSIMNSTESEYECMETNFGGTHRILKAFKELTPNGRFFFMGSSEQFGTAEESPQNESSRFNPRNPYGIAKLASFELVRYYRHAYKLFCCSAISYNQESPLRGEGFVTRKITRTLCRIAAGSEERLDLGNLDAQRDFSHVEDAVEGIYEIIHHYYPQDYILCSGQSHTVREFLDLAIGLIQPYTETNLRLKIGMDARFFSPLEAYPLRGDNGKAKGILGWKPKIPFVDLVTQMVQYDLGLSGLLESRSVD